MLVGWCGVVLVVLGFTEVEDSTADLLCCAVDVVSVDDVVCCAVEAGDELMTLLGVGEAVVGSATLEEAGALDALDGRTW